jgi:adenosylmethionine-8-amino-7-oxononanoate aminotransferase
MKMAMQYWHAKGQEGKCTFATVRSGYHGDTWHAMSVCDPEDGMHTIFNRRLSIQHFVDAPKCRFDTEWDPQDLVSVEQLFTQSSQNIAAFIIEPIVQGAGGMRFYHPEYLAGLARLCQQYNVLLIIDEIATGFGRTGKMFACEWAGVQPDIMTVGKGLTAGYLPMAATLTAAKIGDTISQSSPGVFMHGPTFMGNALAAAAANASMELILSTPIIDNTMQIQAQLMAELAPARNISGVLDVRVLGAIGVIEMQNVVDRQKIMPLFIEQGVWVRPFGHLVYLMPALIMQPDELDQLILGVLNGVKAYVG